MPRPLWKGAISFGMVTIPIKLYTATEEKDVHFNMLHEKDNSRVKQKIFCAEEDEEISRDEVVKGYDIGGGNYVVLDDSDPRLVGHGTATLLDALVFGASRFPIREVRVGGRTVVKDGRHLARDRAEALYSRVVKELFS